MFSMDFENLGVCNSRGGEFLSEGDKAAPG